MILVIKTQIQENYGANDWDGEGQCPQSWKFKGGQEFMVTGVHSGQDIDAIVDCVRDRVEENNEYFREFIIGYGLEEDGYQSWFERSQKEFEGFIQYPETRISWAEIEAEILA